MVNKVLVQSEPLLDIQNKIQALKIELSQTKELCLKMACINKTKEIENDQLQTTIQDKQLQIYNLESNLIQHKNQIYNNENSIYILNNKIRELKVINNR